MRKTTSQVVTTDHANDGLIAVTHGGRTSRIIGENHAAVDRVVGHIIYFGIDLVIVVARPVISKSDWLKTYLVVGTT